MGLGCLLVVRLLHANLSSKSIKIDECGTKVCKVRFGEPLTAYNSHKNPEGCELEAGIGINIY